MRGFFVVCANPPPFTVPLSNEIRLLSRGDRLPLTSDLQFAGVDVFCNAAKGVDRFYSAKESSDR